MKTALRCTFIVLIFLTSAVSLAQGNSDDSNGLAGRVAALEAQNAALQNQLDTLVQYVNDHINDPAAHHTRYTDSEAVAAVGPHYTDAQAVAAVGPHYTDAQAIAAVGPHFSGNHNDLTGVTPDQHHASQAAQVAQLQDLLTHFSRSGNDVFITGANLHIINGTGNTDHTNSLGNLILGYNEGRTYSQGGNHRTGSHMLVAGRGLNYSGAGGIVTGVFNSTSSLFSSVIGGSGNYAFGFTSVIAGGEGNQVSGGFSAVFGGTSNLLFSSEDVIVGGYGNTISNGSSSVIVGGSDNSVDASYSVVSGGFLNKANGFYSTINGGQRNATFGNYSTVSGGNSNEAVHTDSVVLGGIGNSSSGAGSVTP